MPTQGLFLTADWTDTSGLFEANTKIRKPDHRFWKRADDSGPTTNADAKTPQFNPGDSLLVGVNLEGGAPNDVVVTLNVVCSLAKTQPGGSVPSIASPLQDANGNPLCLINEIANPLGHAIETINNYRVTNARVMTTDTYNIGNLSRYEVSVVATASSVQAGMTRQYSYDPDMDVDN